MEKLTEILSKVETLTVTELSELIKMMEQKFGVSAAMPVAAAGAGAGAAEVEEKTSFDVIIKDGGGQKIQVIKALREALGLGLQEAKAMTEGTPKTAKAGMKKDEAEDLKKKLEAAGAKVELK